MRTEGGYNGRPATLREGAEGSEGYMRACGVGRHFHARMPIDKKPSVDADGASPVPSPRNEFIITMLSPTPPPEEEIVRRPPVRRLIFDSDGDDEVDVQVAGALRGEEDEEEVVTPEPNIEVVEPKAPRKKRGEPSVCFVEDEVRERIGNEALDEMRGKRVRRNVFVADEAEEKEKDEEGSTTEEEGCEDDEEDEAADDDEKVKVKDDLKKKRFCELQFFRISDAVEELSEYYNVRYIRKRIDGIFDL